MIRHKFNDYLKQIFSSDFLVKAKELDSKLPNGLQVPGKTEIKKIVTGVSINQEFIQKALAQKADTIIVHHGLMLNFPNNLILTYQAERLRLILANELNLYGFHYALDAHLQFGNNAVLAKKLGANIVGPYFAQWGCVAELPEPWSLDKLKKELEQIVDHKFIAIDGGKKQIKILGLVTGRGVPYHSELPEIIDSQIDAHITGEISEWVPHQFAEMEVSFLAGGHYATERLGIQALTAKIKADLAGQIEIEFIDVNNEV